MLIATTILMSFKSEVKAQDGFWNDKATKITYVITFLSSPPIGVLVVQYLYLTGYQVKSLPPKPVVLKKTSFEISTIYGFANVRRKDMLPMTEDEAILAASESGF